MTTLRFLLLMLIALACNANALVIKDVISFNKQLEHGIYYNFDFDLQKHGYNHLTDTITLVALSYDFSELVDDGHDPDNMDTWETAIFYSRLFDGRSIDPDVSPGNDYQRLAWNKIYDCQFYDFNDICTYNLDLYGNARESVVAYTNNLWLGDVTFMVEFDRIDLPEPMSAVLLALGLIIIMIGISSQPGNSLRMRWQRWYWGH